MTTKTQLFEFLYETCKKNDGVLVDTLIDHGKVYFADPVTVPVQQQSTKRARVA